jgi:hypothetical protein
MAKIKIDGVIEAVHYSPDGQIAWVRAYERRGPTFSDCVLLDRPSLIDRLKARQLLVLGQRKPLWASTFETGSQVQLIRTAGREFIVAGETASDHDFLVGAPVM